MPHLKDGMPVLILLNKVDLLDGNQEIINKRIEDIKKIYDTENRRGGIDPYIKADDKYFKKIK